VVQTIRTQRHDHIVSITMDAGDQLNTIDLARCEQLLDVFDEIGKSDTDRVVVLQGAGRVFSAGGDLVHILQALDSPGDELDTLITRFHEVILAMRRLPLPIIASVHGAAAGAGFSLALACDVIVSASSARFVSGYPGIGTSSDGGLSFQLARRLGIARAFDIFLLRGPIDAHEACRFDLVQRVVEPALLDAETLGVAATLASTSVHAVREIKALLAAVADEDLVRHLQREKAAFLRCASSDEFRRKIVAFVNKSKSENRLTAEGV
jgi:2-(1,2-epoxy-1,2-dihydrophenyl)acetyl-CoA isomerase